MNSVGERFFGVYDERATLDIEAEINKKFVEITNLLDIRCSELPFDDLRDILYQNALAQILNAQNLVNKTITLK
jgi:hypothetical protein